MTIFDVACMPHPESFEIQLDDWPEDLWLRFRWCSETEDWYLTQFEDLAGNEYILSRGDMAKTNWRVRAISMDAGDALSLGEQQRELGRCLA